VGAGASRRLDNKGAASSAATEDRTSVGKSVRLRRVVGDLMKSSLFSSHVNVWGAE
jgi:hypothetical protein